MQELDLHKMGEVQYEGFFSYVESDDAHEDGRIIAIKYRLEREIAMRVGSEFPIFHDRYSSLVGQRWRDEYEIVMDGTKFLIAVITPSFLKSSVCRDEVEMFITREDSQKRKDLIFPILYLNSPSLDDPEDAIAVDLNNRKRFDWGDLRFENPDSNPFRKAVSDIGAQVVHSIWFSQDSPREPSYILYSKIPGISILNDDLDLLDILREVIGESSTLLGKIRVFHAIVETLDLHMRVNESPSELADGIGDLALVGHPYFHTDTDGYEDIAQNIEDIAYEYTDCLWRLNSGFDFIFDALTAESVDESELEPARTLAFSLDDLVSEAGNRFDFISRAMKALSRSAYYSGFMRSSSRRIISASRILLDSEERLHYWNDGMSVIQSDLNNDKV